MRMVNNQDEAEDLVQETAYKAFKYLRLYQQDTNFIAWLMTIQRNIFINNYRRSQKQQYIFEQAVGHHLISAQDRTVSNEGESTMAMNELNGLIEQLNEEFKTPFLMSYKGFKYHEIAEQLDLPLGTIKSRIFFARKQLQKSLHHRFAANNFIEVLN
jgi:RNA polymerase sigma-70 factor (ECF subfamily)